MISSNVYQEQLRGQIVRGLLGSKRTLNEAVLRRKADIAGLKLDSGYRLFSIIVTDEIMRLAVLVAALRANFEDQDNVIVLVEGEIYCIAQAVLARPRKQITARALKRFFASQGVRVNIASSCLHAGAEELLSAAEEVRQAQLVGNKIWPNKSIYSADEMGMYIGIMPDVSKGLRANIAARLISPLVQDKVLLQTVEIFLQTSLNVTDAARRLKVHRNTLLYRLEKVKKLTSFDVTKFEDALHIKLGLLIMLGDKVL